MATSSGSSRAGVVLAAAALTLAPRAGTGARAILCLIPSGKLRQHACRRPPLAGRDYLGIELEAEYRDLARRRLSGSRDMCSAMQLA